MRLSRPFHRGRQRRRIRQQLGKAALVVNGKADHMRLFDGSARHFFCSRCHKIAHTAPLQLGGMFHDSQCLRRDARFQARRSVYL